MVQFQTEWLNQRDPYGALYGSYILHDPSNTEEVSCSICFHHRIRIATRGLTSLRNHASSQRHRIRSLEAASRKMPAEAKAEPPSPKAPAETKAEPPSPKAPAETKAEPPSPKAPARVKFNPKWLELSDPSGALYGSYILYDPSNPSGQVSCSICFHRRISFISRGFAALRDHAVSQKHFIRSLKAASRKMPAEAKAEPPSPKAPAETKAEPPSPKAPAEAEAEPPSPKAPAEAEPSKAQIKKDHGIQILSNELIKLAGAQTSSCFETEPDDSKIRSTQMYPIQLYDADTAMEYLGRSGIFSVIPVQPETITIQTIDHNGSASRPVTPVMTAHSNFRYGTGSTIGIIGHHESTTRPVTPVTSPMTIDTIDHNGSASRLVTPVMTAHSNFRYGTGSTIGIIGHHGSTTRPVTPVTSPMTIDTIDHNGSASRPVTPVMTAHSNFRYGTGSTIGIIGHHGSTSRPVTPVTSPMIIDTITPRSTFYDKDPDQENLNPESNAQSFKFDRKSASSFGQPNAASGRVLGRSTFSNLPSDFPKRSEDSGFSTMNEISEFITSTPTRPVPHQSPGHMYQFDYDLNPHQTPGTAGTRISSSVGAARLPMVNPVPPPNPVSGASEEAGSPSMSGPLPSKQNTLARKRKIDYDLDFSPRRTPGAAGTAISATVGAARLPMVPQHTGKRAPPTFSKQSGAAAGPSGQVPGVGAGAGAGSPSTSGPLPTRPLSSKTPSVKITFQIETKSFKGKRNAEPKETVEIECADVQQLVDCLWEKAKKYIEREVLFRPGVEDEPPQVASWSSDPPIIEHIDNYIDITPVDKKSKTFSAGAFLLDPGKMVRLNQSQAKAYVYKYSKNVISQDFLNYVESQLVVKENGTDRAGAASNQQLQEIVEKLILYHSKKFDAQWIAYYMWATDIQKIAPKNPDDFERFLQRGPPQHLIQNFRVRDINRQPHLEERFVLAKNTNDSYSDLFKQLELDLAALKQIKIDESIVLERVLLRFDLIMRNHASRSEIINSTVTRPVETSRSRQLASRVTNCEDIDHAE